MRIESVRIHNYRSIQDSGALSFSSGFNLVVGANNVGKSSLLLCLATRFNGEPHKSITTLPFRDELLNQISRVDLTLVATSDEVRRVLLNVTNGHIRIPWPADLQLANEQVGEVLRRFFDAHELHFRASAQASPGGGPGWLLDQYPSTRVYPPLLPTGAHPMAVIEVNQSSRTITAVQMDPNVNPSADFGVVISANIAQRIYRFSAERLNIGVSPMGGTHELAPDARNLPEALNILQGNPTRFESYCRLVKEVFPSIQKISVRPHPSTPQHVEIMIWQIDPLLEREDLAIALTQCGTGVGQVLAMLYIAKTSDQPRTIIIDEPGSFLHPGASRALIAILKRFSTHQYIIATHSPEIISELSDSPVTIIRWEDSKSAVEQSTHTTGTVAMTVLSEIGARLSDVFGFDNILWVEGQSDALSLRVLLDAVGETNRRLGILPVRDTGSFNRRTIAEVLEIYHALSTGGALLPPALLFLFDRDGRSVQEIEDATRTSKGKVRFLSRRMFENYLLKSAPIAQLFNEAGKDFEIETSNDEVERWILENGRTFCDAQDAPQPFSPAWLEVVNGGLLLRHLFDDLSTNRLTYRKTTHTPRLTALVHQMEKPAVQEILTLVSDVIENKAF